MHTYTYTHCTFTCLLPLLLIAGYPLPWSLAGRGRDQVLRDVLTILAQPPVPVSSSSSNGPIPARGASGPRGGRCGRGVPLALVALASVSTIRGEREREMDSWPSLR